MNTPVQKYYFCLIHHLAIVAVAPIQSKDWPEENLHKGEGFDFATQTHLQQNFGYAYVNPLWNLASEEYSPAREITAMVYPLFEFSLIIYIILNFVTTILANRRGELTVWFWQFSKAAFAITLILFTQFRKYCRT